MELNKSLVEHVVILSSRISKARGKKTYLSEAKPSNNETIYEGKRGAKYFYRLGNEPTTDQKDGTTFIPKSHGQFRRILMNEGSNARYDILNHLYGHPSYKIDWEKINNYGSGDSRVRGVIYDSKTGRKSGVIERKFRANKTVVHDKLELADTLPKGIATAMNDRAEEIYRKMGYKKVKLDADISIGKYAWARQGYNWTYSSRKRVLEEVKELLNSSFLENPDNITFGTGFFEKLDSSYPVLDDNARSIKDRVNHYSNMLKENENNLNELENKLERFSNSEDKIQLLLDKRDDIKGNISFYKSVINEANNQYKRYVDILPKIHDYRRIDMKTGKITEVDAYTMQKRLFRNAYSKLLKNNNNLRYSWDLAKADNGKLYKNYNEDYPEAKYPLGKALMLSLPSSWTAVKDLDKNSINYRIGKEYLLEKKI